MARLWPPVPQLPGAVSPSAANMSGGSCTLGFRIEGPGLRAYEFQFLVCRIWGSVSFLVYGSMVQGLELGTNGCG